MTHSFEDWRQRLAEARGYEMASDHSPLEYGASGGFITLGRGSRVDPTAKSRGPQVLDGFATLYGKPHSYKGRIDVFARGCFARTLSAKSTVKFLLDHDPSIRLGDTETNLELVDSDRGLGFRLGIKESDVSRLNGREQMSVGYEYSDADNEEMTIEGERVRLIKRANLVEISAVYSGAVKQTHALLRDAGSVGNLRDDVKTIFATDSAAIAVTRALAALQRAAVTG